jgi:hypothetical protein
MSALPAALPRSSRSTTRTPTGNKWARGNEIKEALVSDHAELYDPEVARRYFAKFAAIGGYLAKVAAEFETEGRLTRTEARVLGGYLAGVIGTFKALNHKYLMTGKAEAASRLTIDRHESGFPVAQELMVMALDAASRPTSIWPAWPARPS